MFLSKTKRQTRFEKFVSTLIIVSMSFSFLLTGIPSQGGVRPNAGDSGIEKAEAVELGKIAFNSDRDGITNIYIMNADGTNTTRLTNAASNWGARLSSDGSKIVFISNRDGNNEIYSMNSDGMNQTRLTINSYSDNGADWSPDGSKIVFDSQRPGDDSIDIYTMDANGNNQNRLLTQPTEDQGPVWSPDGTKIVFFSKNGSFPDYDVWTVNSDGTSPTRLTTASGHDYMGSWSPDSSEIVFNSARDGNDNIYKMTTGGFSQTPLTTDSASDAAPVFSPDGSKIAFQSYRDGNGQLYIMDPDGSNQNRITSSYNDSSPDWGPGSVPPPDTTEVTNPDATDLTSLYALVNETKADFNTHRLLTDGVHGVPDTSSEVTNPDATDLTTAITLVNQIKLRYEEHRWLLAGIHGAYDTINEVTSANATDEATAITLANEIKGDYNAHRILADGVHGGASDTTPPVVNVTSPTESANVSGSVTISATVDDSATGNSIVGSAEYFIDVTGSYGTGATLPFVVGPPDSSIEDVSAIWDSTQASDGTHTIYVRATDDKGNWSNFVAVNVNVSNGGPPPDNQGPSAFIAQPGEAQVVSGAVNISSDISDLGFGYSNIQAAEFFIDTPGTNGTGLQMTPSDGFFNTSWEMADGSWNSTTVLDGQHTIYVHGLDAAGNWGVFGQVTVNVNNGPPPSPATISGKVLSGTQAVSNATVYIYGDWNTGYHYSSTMSNSEGNYSFDVPSGSNFTYSVYAYVYNEATGYYHYSTNYPQVIANDPIEYSGNNLLMNLPPPSSGTATISGKVSSGGQPVESATVNISGSWQTGYYYNSTTTGVNGTYSFDVPAGEGYTYWLGAGKYNASTGQYQYSSNYPEVIASLTATYPDVNLNMGIPAPLITNPQYGETVYTSSVLIEGNASPSANIEIKRYDTNWNLTGTYLTNANPLDGTFIFSATPINGHNYLLVTQQLGVDISSPAWVYFYSNAISFPATISGKVLSSEGTPVAYATVNIGGSWQTNLFSSSTTTDVSGAYSFTVPSGTEFVYWLDAYKYDPVTGQSHWNINYPMVFADTPGTYTAEDLNFNFGPPTVTKPDMDALVKSSSVGIVGHGQQSAAINVDIYSYDNNWWYTGYDNTQSGLADGAGNFNFNVTLPNSGHHYLYISQTKDGYTSESVYRHLTANFADDLTNNAIISGTVTQGGNPVDGASVYVWQNYYGGNYVGYIPPDTTDVSGAYSIPVPKGASYSIYTYDNLGNYSSTKIVPATGTTVAGQTYNVDLSFKPSPPTINPSIYGGTVSTPTTSISGTADPGATVSVNIESYDMSWNWKSNKDTTTADEYGDWSIDVSVSNGYAYISASQTSGGEESYLTYSYFYVQLAAYSATISGQVLSAGQGVFDATVYIYGSYPSYYYNSIQTDGGDYSFTVEGNNSYWLYAYKYDSTTGNYLYSNWEYISVSTGTTNKDIAMKPPAPKINTPAQGSNVTDATTTISGTASASLPVTIKVSGYTSTGAYEEKTYTVNAGSNGNFSKSGVVVYNSYNTVYAYQTDSAIDSDWAYHYYYGQLIVSSGTLSGIISQNGSPVSGATVYAYSASGWWSNYVTTAPDGTYTIKLPSEGSYYVYAYKGDSYSSYPYPLIPSTGTIADGGSYTQNLNLPPSAPSVTYPSNANTYSATTGKLTANGTALANATINLSIYSYNIYGYYTVNSYSTNADSSGNWSKEINVDNGDNYLYVSQTDTLGNVSNSAYVGFYVKDAPQSFTQTGMLSGIVTNAKTGAPVEGATVLAYTYSTNFTAVTDVNGNYTITLPATGGWGTYLTAYSYVTSSGKYGSAPAQSFWVTDGSNTNADFKLAFAEGINGDLSAKWNYREGKIDYRMVIGASPGIDNLDASSTNLEIVTGSDEYYAQDPNLSGWASGIIRTFNADGTLNWIKSTDNDEARSSVAIADTDSDGKLEVALGTTSGSQMQLWSNAGVKNWTKGTGGFVHSSPAIADLVPTKTGSEVIAGSYDGKIYVQDKDGNNIWSYPKDASYSAIVSSPSVGDLDKNGSREVVFGSTDKKVYVLTNSGSLAYSYTTDGEINSSPARADLDKDGKDEIIIGSNDGYVYALSIPAFGSTLSVLWKYKTGGQVYSSPSVADIDKNGNLDVVVGSNDGYIYALTSNGGLKWKYQTGASVYSSAALANRGINTAGYDSVGVYIGSEDGSLYLIEGNGTNAGKLIDRFDTGALIRTSPAVADTDGNGKLDIFFSDWRSGGDMFWALEDNSSSVTEHSKQWPQFGYNASHRRTKLDLTTNVAPAAPTIISPASPHYSQTTAVSISGTTTADSILEIYNGSELIMTSSVSGTTAFSANLPNLLEGTHKITAKARIGTMQSDLSSLKTIIIDTTKPTINISGVAQSQSYSSGVKANYSASDASPTNVSATLNSSPYTSGTPIVDAGNYQLVVTATDSAGNTMTKTVNFTVTVDTTPPSITFIDPTPLNDSSIYTSAVTVKAKVSDEGSGVDTIVLRRTLPTTEIIPIEIVALQLTSVQPITVTIGTNKFEVEVKDNAGNTTTKAVKFYYKAVQPSLGITPSSIEPGDKITLTGASFIENDIVKITRITADGKEVYVGSATTDGTGAFTYDYTTPANISAGARTFKAVGSYNTQASATVNVKLDFYPESGTSFKQTDNPTIYVNGGSVAKTMALSYRVYPTTGADPTAITPVTQESNSTWHYAKWTTNIIPKGSYEVIAETKDANGNTIKSSAIYHITDKDLSLKFAPQSGSTITRPIDTSSIQLKVLAGVDVQSVAFSYQPSGTTAYTDIGVDTQMSADSFFDIFTEISLDGNIKVKATPNNEPSKAVVANYILKSPTKLVLYPPDGSTIDPNQTLYVYKASGEATSVSFSYIDGNGEQQIAEDSSIDNGWFEVVFNTAGLIDGVTYKVKAQSNDGTVVEAAYKYSSGVSIEIVDPATGATLTGSQATIWMSASDEVSKIDIKVLGSNGNEISGKGGSASKYPNTSLYYFDLDLSNLADKDITVEATPNDLTNLKKSVNYFVKSEPLDIELYPLSGTTLKKDAVFKITGSSTVNTVELYYQVKDVSGSYSDSEPLPTKEGSNILTRTSTTLPFSATLESEDLEDGEYKVTAIAYDQNKQNSNAVANEYTLDVKPPKAVNVIQVTFSTNKGVEIHWADPKNQTDDRAGYYVYRSTPSTTSFEEIAYVEYDGKDSSYFYNDWNVQKDVTYYYYVTADDEGGNESNPSNVKGITPNDDPDTGEDDKGKGKGGSSDGIKVKSSGGSYTEVDVPSTALNQDIVLSITPVNTASADTVLEKKLLIEFGQKMNDYKTSDSTIENIERVGSIYDILAVDAQTDVAIKDLEDYATITFQSDALKNLSADQLSEVKVLYYEGGALQEAQIIVGSYDAVAGTIKVRIKSFSSYSLFKVRRFKESGGGGGGSGGGGGFLPDEAAPTTTYTILPQPNEYGWYNEDVEVMLSAQDNEGGMGLDTILYKVGSSTNYSAYTTPIILNTEGIHTITYYSQDKATPIPNTELEKTLSIKIDKTKPSGTASLKAGAAFTKLRTINVNLSAQDQTGLSGIAKVKLATSTSSLETVAWQDYTSTKTVTLTPGDGKKTIYVRYKDKADNTSNTVTDTIILDTTKPRILSYYTSPNPVKRGRYLKAYYKATDARSPKVYVTVKLINPKGKAILNKALGAKTKGTLLYYSYKVPSTAVVGSYKYIVILRDYAGNILTTSAKYFKVVR